MKLEQLMYQPRKALEAPQRYRVNDLESLSATVLYDSGKLHIRNFPTIQLHAHEVDGKITGANIKGKGKKSGKGYPLTNYEWAMADYYADILKASKRTEKE